ncbi:peptide methionine sulfoxide reductase [Flavobacterium saliperosum S13]|uniref:Peptide methionine sulfoxide reductase MsrA n=3 Tax=Flavobacterium saliperosum TaxID=329186 RepID=A0A1G4W0J1_9FLAO|nr:peptide methionine sulfoxide reductase [Flavobacterium saliperosum S13]SCX14842.1 peptide-methionine (S)-S-oxide reductase [Flavobacterium saliperosum]
MKNLFFCYLATIAFACEAKGNKSKADMEIQTMGTENQKSVKATFAGGCFWCTEALFLEIKGVEKVVPGYTGGKVVNPTYEEVCEGTTGHAEAIEITYNPELISYEDLLEVFFGTHDPTTLNRQGADVGTQYRSEIFYHSEAQKKAAENFIDLLNTQNFYGKKVVTKISPAVRFYVAEEYHKNYYNRNKNQGYCMAVIAPKLDKLKKNYQSKLKN